MPLHCLNPTQSKQNNLILIYIFNFTSCCVHACPWRSEVNATGPPLLLSTLCFEISSPTQPGAQQFSWGVSQWSLELWGPTCLHTPFPLLVRGLQMPSTMPGFHVLFRDPHSDCHACVSSTLTPSLLSSRPILKFKLYRRKTLSDE